MKNAAAVATFLCGLALSGAGRAQKLVTGPTKPISVPTAPGPDAHPQPFRDPRFGVRFAVPPGWSVYRKDGEVSTFHSDARSAPRSTVMRGVASLGFNPYPDSVLSGATFYFSVERHAKAAECAAQAAKKPAEADLQDIGGMEFRHGHDEHGQICVEARDEIYTAYRKGACYRFDLEVNTFCSVSSGADDLTERQMIAIEQQMTDILSSVALDWKKNGTHAVPVPPLVRAQPKPEPELLPRTPAAAHESE